MIVDVIVGLSTFGGVLAVIGLWFGLLVVMFSIVYVAYKIIHRNDKGEKIMERILSFLSIVCKRGFNT